MQKYSKLLIVLPCHSMEDFPIHYRGSEAAELLANWTSLWHPALISSSATPPNWIPADNPDPDFGETSVGHCVVVVPSVSTSTIDPELMRNLENRHALVISNQPSRAEIIRLAVQGNELSRSLAAKLDSALASDFMALGYAFLQIQIMTRQLRYSSNLDEERFWKTVVAAANSATAGNHDQAREALTRCFDLLLEEKNAYYPVEPELIDLVLTTSTTIGDALNRQLDREHEFNVLLTGVVSDRIFAERKPSAERLKQKLKDCRIVGGLFDELPDNLLSTETSLNQLLLGRANLRNHWGVEPSVFMRRRFGLNPALPGMLNQLNFVGAMHATLDDGKFPSGSNCNICWTGDDDRSILSIGNSPMAADDAGPFLGLAVRLGQAIDSAHMAAAVFVHWPDQTCESFQDLIRVTNYGPLFGSFVRLNDYFDRVYDPGFGDRFSADEYRTPFLRQAVERQTPDPISSVIKYWERFYQLSACRSLLTQIWPKSNLNAKRALEFQHQIDELQLTVELGLNVATDDQEVDRQIKGLTNELRVAWHLDSPSPVPCSENAPVELMNTTSFRRRVEFKAAALTSGTLKHDPPVVICDSTQADAHWILDIPPMGSVEIDPLTPGSDNLLRSDPDVGKDRLLRNEFFELQVDATTGGIRSIQLYHQRANLVSQQLAMRIPANQDASTGPLTRSRYTRMVADQIELKSESRLAATIISHGKLLDDAKVVAEFQQSVRVVRGKRVVEIELEVSPGQPLSMSMNHYICSRLAWKNEAARIVANAQETRSEVNSDWFLATNFFEVVQDVGRVTLLTGGLPYHRRATRRITDSLLIVGNERRRRFRFGLGIKLPYPASAAVSWMTPPITVKSVAVGEGKNRSNWLFHFDRKNILATWWRPFFDEDSRWAGVLIRLRETEGRAGKLGIQCPRPIASGEQVNFEGDFLRSLPIASDNPGKLEIEFGRFDFLQISIHWKL